MHLAYIALGGNLADPLQSFEQAIDLISKIDGTSLKELSRLYRSKPHGDLNQPLFLNAVLAVSTTLSPEDLLRTLQQIENSMGRVREKVWGPRNIDLDIILYDNIRMTTDFLTIPHAFAHLREFVLAPLYDLDPSLVIPGQGKVAELLKTVPMDNLEVISNATTPYH